MKQVVTLLVLLLMTTPIFAQLTVVSQWRLGEDDASAKSGAAVAESLDSSAAKRTVKSIANPVYADSVSDAAKGSRLCVHFDGKSVLQRKGLADLRDNFVAEAFARATTDEGFHVAIQYGSGGHGWSLVRNGKGYQVLLGGKALVGWSGDVASGEWVHLAVARVDGVTRFYFNGKLSGDNNAEPNQAGADATLTIGGDVDLKQCFSGDIDEVRVSTFPSGSFDADVLEVNDPDGANAKRSPAKSQVPAAAGDAAASIDFDADPVCKNMSFSRAGLVASTVAADNGEKQAWVAQQGSAPDVPWARSVLVTLTDPALREGRQPVVDVEIEFRQTFNSPVELRADTAAGSRVVGGSWGRNGNWQKFTARIDDAFFGARQFGHKTSDMHTDGYDLRINSFGGDFAIRSIRVRAYDLADKPDFKRVFRFDGVSTANDLLIFAPGSTASIDYRFSNLAQKDAPLAFRHEVLDRDDKLIRQSSGAYTALARGSNPLSVSVDTKGLPLGAYRTHLQLLSSDGATIFERRGGFAVADETPVARAKPGEFLYGLDIRQGPAYQVPRLLRWAKFMGVDIIRHGFESENIDELAAHLPEYEASGLQSLFNCDPPKTLDAGERTAQLASKTQFLEAVARRFPTIKYFELGNEPDLTFFYPGAMDNYVADYQAMYAAIHRGNPSAQVMNGGLSFAGAEATERSKQFVQLVDPSKIDVWCYHGHGPGEAAESMSLNRIRDLVRAQDKLKPFADSETGVAAQTPAQEAVQARTVVQKMVYAQAQKEPLLMFFRLLMFEEAYGMLYSEQEPRQSVPAYANMVRTLRGQRFDKPLDGTSGAVKGYLFTADDALSRSCVLWSESGGPQQLQFSLGSVPGTGLKQIDLFGNTADLVATANGSFVISVGADPTYLKWNGSARAPELHVIPSAFELASEVSIRDGGDDSIAVILTSHDGHAVEGTLNVAPGASSNVSLPQASFPVKIAAGQSTTILVPLSVHAVAGTIDWPKQWTAFVDVDDSKIDIASLATIPATLPSRSAGQASAQHVLLHNDRIDFEQLGGKINERTPAVVIATVNSEKEQTVRFGASADWWMQWAVNGKVVYSTLDRGNGGGYSVSDHTFDITLKKGENVIAAKVLSGSMGWKLLIGYPDRLAQAAAGNATADLHFALERAGGITETRDVALRRIPPMQPLADAAAAGKLQYWDSVQPDLVMIDHIDNAFAKMPDASKWWHGPADLSARGWVRGEKNALAIFLAVTDDQHHPAASLDAIEQGDGVRLNLSGKNLRWRVDVAAAPSDGDALCNVTLVDPAKTATASAALAHVYRHEQTTFYQINVAVQPGESPPDFLDATVFDRDEIAGKQRLTLSPVGSTGVNGWYRLVWP